MGVKAGDFYVNLGVKSADKTISDVKGVQSGFEGLKASALETKVALLAVFAIVEKITASSLALGQTLKNFTAITGISTKTTQEYSLAGKPYGVSEETTRSTLASIQTSMIGMKAGQDAPPWFLAMIRSLQEHGVKVDVSKGAIDRYAAHPEEILQLQQKFENMKQIPISERTYVMREQGVPDEMLAAFRSNAYGSQNIKNYEKDVLTDEQLNRLFLANKAKTDITSDIEAKKNQVVSDVAIDTKVEASGLAAYEKKHAEALKRQEEAIQAIANSDKHLAPVVHKTVNISKTSNNSFTGVSAKDVPAIKKATQTDHADDIALTNSAHQDR